MRGVADNKAIRGVSGPRGRGNTKAFGQAFKGHRYQASDYGIAFGGVKENLDVAYVLSEGPQLSDLWRIMCATKSEKSSQFERTS